MLSYTHCFIRRLSLLLLASVLMQAPSEARQRLLVSDNKRFLVHKGGAPFFYLADTAWELFHRLNREEADHYLRNRAERGFTVIQAVVLAELDGLHDPNPYGHTPLTGGDPKKPDEDYFRHVDWIVNRAEQFGLTVGMLPTWGSHWHDGGGPPARPKSTLFNGNNARVFGRFLGHRYKDKPIIWILGGDRPIETPAHHAVIRAMAGGLREGDGGAHLITFHPPGGRGSSEWFRDDWLDFNMRQNGHADGFGRHYENTHSDYARTDPIKPVIDGEPLYEDHPISFRPEEFGHSIAADVRRPLYWNLFGGAFGHTYGHHSVWQMYAPGRNPINRPLMPWFQALDQPGAQQMQFARWLLMSRPFLSRIPDDSILVSAEPTSVPGAGIRRYVATRDAEGSYAMVYAPVGRPFSVRLDAIKGPQVNAWWFDPRTGKAEAIGEFPAQDTRVFTPPVVGEMLDWVLVLDDASRNFPPPGSRQPVLQGRPAR